jgi:hypothetical protein
MFKNFGFSIALVFAASSMLTARVQQMIAEWPQCFNTYLLDTNNVVVNPQVVWNASSDWIRFDITQVVPMNLLPQDKNVFSVGPFAEDRDIAVYCSHKKAGATSFTDSDPRHSFVRVSISRVRAGAWS